MAGFQKRVAEIDRYEFVLEAFFHVLGQFAIS
jgi:hypothetical protein